MSNLFINQNSEQQSINNRLVNERQRNDTILTKMPNKSTFMKSYEHAFTCDSGKLIPVLVQEVYPGDIYEIDVKTLIRLSAMASTPYSNINYDINFFYVPHTQIDKQFKEVQGENDDAGIRDDVIPFPSIDFSGFVNFYYTENDVAGYMGVPINVDMKRALGKERLCIYDYLAYIQIWNKWYRDQNVQDSADMSSFEANTDRAIKTGLSDYTNFYTSLIYGKGLAPASKLPNYFMSALPYRQKGKPVQLFSVNDVTLKSLTISNGILSENEKFSPYWYYSNNSAINDGYTLKTAYNNPSNGTRVSNISGGSNLGNAYLSLKTNEQHNPFVGEFEPIDINNLREAIVTQHYLETLALCGSRYIEQLKSIWGVEVNPLEINRPELIGGINDNLIFNSVQQTSETTATQPLGKIASNLYNNVSCPKISYAAKYHGLIIGILVLRTTINNGGQGLPKRFLYKDYLDMFNPIWNGIGEQPIKNYEIKLSENNAENMEIFAYNEPWLNTKFNIDTASGFMSLNSKTSLFAKFLYGEKYDTIPKMSDKFMRYDSNIIGNTLFNVSSSTKEFYHQFACYFYFDIKYTSSQPLYNEPGVDSI